MRKVTTLLLMAMLSLTTMAATINADTFTQKHYKDDGDTSCKLSTARFTFYFDIKTLELEYGKTYTLSDMYAEFTGYYDARTDKDFEPSEASLTLLHAADGLDSVYATMTAGGTEFEIIYKRVLPDVSEEIEIVTYNLEMDEKEQAERGVIYCDAVAEFYEVYLILKSWETDGHYGVYDVECAYSFVGDLDTREQGFVVDADIVISTDEEYGITHLSGDVLLHNGWLCHLDIYTPGVMNFDCVDRDVEATFSDIYINTESVTDGGGLHVSGVDVTGSYGMDLSFVVTADELDAEIIVPVGTYKVSDSAEPHTVVASPGVLGYDLYSSFVATVDEDGLRTPLWFIEEGEVVVTKENGKLKIEVDAINSNGRTIRLHVLDSSAQGLMGVKTDKQGVKTLRDGQLLIEYNGRVYNVLGERK